MLSIYSIYLFIKKRPKLIFESWAVLLCHVGRLEKHVGEAEKAEPGAVGRPDPAPGEPEHRGEDRVSAVLLAQQDDVGVGGGVEEEGDKGVGGALQGSVDWR